MSPEPKCVDELKSIFPSPENFEDLAGKVLTSNEFAQMLFQNREHIVNCAERT